MLPGDWRSAKWGAVRRAHLFTFYLSHKRHTACDANVAYENTGAAEVRASKDLCIDCLAAGATGRA